jgi:hypothetical protein
MATVHKCDKEAEISAIHTKVNALWHTIEGNGKPGLNDTVVELATVIRELKGALDRKDTKNQWRTGLIITIAGTIITLINVLLVNL